MIEGKEWGEGVTVKVAASPSSLVLSMASTPPCSQTPSRALKEPSDLAMPANISARALEEADSERMMMPSGPSPIPLRALLLPRCPCVGKHTQPPFITKSSFPRAAILGLQHALIAFATITIVPNRVASVGRFELQASHAIRMYAIIVTALASLLQCARLSASPLPTDFSQRFSARTLPAHVGLSCQFSIAHLLNWQLGTGIISLLGAPLLLLPVIERAMVDGMIMDSSMTCNSDFDCTNSWANAEGVSIEGVSLTALLLPELFQMH